MTKDKTMISVENYFHSVVYMIVDMKIVFFFIVVLLCVNNLFVPLRRDVVQLSLSRFTARGQCCLCDCVFGKVKPQ